MKITDKVKPTKGCISGNHKFIVTAWKKSTTKDVAVGLTCQFCLMPADKLDLEVMTCCHHDRLKEKPATKKETTKA